MARIGSVFPVLHRRRTAAMKDGKNEGWSRMPNPCLRMGLHAVAASQLVFSSFHPVDQTNVVKLRQKA